MHMRTYIHTNAKAHVCVHTPTHLLYYIHTNAEACVCIYTFTHIFAHTLTLSLLSLALTSFSLSGLDW